MKIDTIKKIAKTRAVFIWGASNFGGAILAVCENKGIKVQGFIDNNTSISGENISGYKVYNSEILGEYQGEKKAYIIFSTNVVTSHLKMQCAKYGYKNQIDYDVIDNQYTVSVDVVGACNLKCPSCARGNYLAEKSLPNGIITIRNFERLVIKIKKEMPELIAISLFNWGEPFLHPQLSELVKLCNKYELFCVLSTNFSITSNFDEVIKQNPGWMKVSISGDSQEIYQTTHTGGNVNLVKSNLYRLRYLLDEYKANTIVEIGYHEYKNNRDDEYRKIHAISENLGFVFKSVIAGDTTLEKILDIKKGIDVRSPLDKLLLLGNSLPNSTIEEKGELDLSNKFCRYSVENISIHYDGSILPCCRVFSKENVIEGINFFDTPLEEILRKKLNANICVECKEYNCYQLG